MANFKGSESAMSFFGMRSIIVLSGLVFLSGCERVVRGVEAGVCVVFGGLVAVAGLAIIKEIQDWSKGK